MKEINWKSFSFSLIISTIIHGTVVSIFLYRYKYNFEDILSDYTILWKKYMQLLSGNTVNNSSINGSKTSTTIVYGGSLFPFWVWILIFCISYVFVTMISYYLINFLNQRKK